MEKYGVIDLGTNTFHLLIAGFEADGRIREIYRERRFVKLAENGIETIGPAPFRRGIATVESFAAQLKAHGVEQVAAVGTAALRTAVNGGAFIAAVKQKTGIAIALISGEEEARLIHQGVLQTGILRTGTKALIMDIGGGSVELILADGEGVAWMGSFLIGVAVLHRRFHHSDPISAAEVAALEAFLDSELRPVRQPLLREAPTMLVGAAGTFDVLADLFATERIPPGCTRLEAAQFFPFLHQMQNATLAERYATPGVPAARADMIVVALLLIARVLKMARLEKIVVSNYAMKEGMLYGMQQQHRY